VLRHFMTNLPAPFDVATGDPRLCGIVVGVDDQTGRALDIQRIHVAGADLEELEAFDNEEG